MASLPEFRVRESFPFSKVGVDFAGPLYVKDKTKEMNKVYIALFICCVTRAVHLELVEAEEQQLDISALKYLVVTRKHPGNGKNS